MNACTCGATTKHSADCVIFWEPMPREMTIGDLCDWSYLPQHVGPYTDRHWASASDGGVDANTVHYGFPFNLETATGVELDRHLWGARRPVGMSDKGLRDLIRGKSFAEVLKHCPPWTDDAA